jgi:tRNA dimethylallyltransferase
MNDNSNKQFALSHGKFPGRMPILLAGPTGVGKSDVAMAVAETLRGEILVVDSMQAYRGLDIGTAKPSAADQKRVRHYLLDVVDLRESFDAARFVSLARLALEQIASRDRVPILCGGTGFYFKALLDGIGAAPPGDPSLRERLERLPLSDLLGELEKCDPVLFSRIDRNNPRRVLRAVEVCRLTGKPFSQQQADWNSAGDPIDLPNVRFVGLRRSKEDLRQRIDERVDRMFELGLVDETRRLLELGLEKNPTAMQAIGYRQVVEYLRGVRSLPETFELIKVRTRQFAKRQMTWFQRHAKLEWISIEDSTSTLDVAQQVISIYEAPSIG